MFQLFATVNTAAYLKLHNIAAQEVGWPIADKMAQETTKATRYVVVNS